MNIGLTNQIIKKNLSTNGRVMLVASNSWLTINHCPTTRQYEIEGVNDKKKKFGTAYATTIDSALNLAQHHIGFKVCDITKII